ncbi:uncharacterized protein LOC143535609 [Bidens hawaiensis]|uniref:uncharacterized protein LOC143535609 n=1 Tax=Bidens hawaiensis TaxID=980011 RepID=UPI00404B3537
MSLPQDLWGEAVHHSVYLLNRSPTKSLKDSTPYERIKGRKPNLSHVKVFGCTGYVKVLGTGQKKLDDRSIVMIHLGTQPGTKAYRMFDPIKRRVHVTRDVKFDECKRYAWADLDKQDGEKGPEWTEFIVRCDIELEPEQVTTGSVDRHDTGELVRIRNGSDSSSSDGVSPPISPTRPDTSLNEEPLQVIQPRRTTRKTVLPKKFRDFLVEGIPTPAEQDPTTDEVNLLLLFDDEPVNFREANNEKHWRNAMEAEIESIERNKT